MSPLATWALTIGLVGLLLVGALIVNAWLDRLTERLERRRRTDPEVIFRHDRARDVMRGWDES